MLREEQILGRAQEEPGRLTARLLVRRVGRPLLDQELSFGPGTPGGWSGPAVLHGHRAAGQLLVVDPKFEQKPPETRILSDDPEEGEAVRTALVGPASSPVSLRRTNNTASRCGYDATPSPAPPGPDVRAAACVSVNSRLRTR